MTADDASFVIACPACLGHLAAAVSLVGNPACCPLCAAAFLVPDPRLAEAVYRSPPPVAEPQAAPAPEARPAAVVVRQPPPDEAFDPILEPPPVAAGDAALAAIPGLALREPVKTLGRGADAIELKRLSDEERRIRRGRRNVILLLVGAALLAALVVLLGLPAGRR